MTDSILGQSNTKLRSSESRLASAMFSFAETVRNSTKPSVTASKKVQATFSKLDLALAELAELIDGLQTISGQEIFPNLSTSCSDINTKIIYIETNLRKYAALGVQARVNMSMLQISIANVVTYVKVEKSTLNVSSIVNQGKTVITNFQNYLTQLTNSIKAELTVKANYENYRRGNCICSAESTMSTSTQLTGFIKMILEVDTTLRTNQGNIKTSITSALPKITATIAANISELTNFNLQQLQSHFRRVSTCSDHPVDNITVTSCTELLALVGRSQFRGWLTMQVGIVERNLTLSSKYLANLKQTLSASTTLTETQKSALTSTVEAVTAALSTLTKYSTDLKSFSQKLASASTELKTLADNFCLCKSSETTTTVSTLPPTNSQCRISGEIWDVSGALIKKACFVDGTLTISAADAKCKSLNMTLYSISDDADARALLVIVYKASMALFGTLDNKVYKVNGKQRADGSWYYFNPNTTALPKEAIPMNATGSNNCLTVNGGANTTVYASTSCDALNWAICEFGKVLPPTNIAPAMNQTTTTSSTVDAMPCGTLLTYNITSSMNGPDTLGFASGTYYDNSTIYPGTTEFGGRNCGQQYPGPSRIQIGRSLKGPGGYFPCGNAEWFDATTVKFFANHPSLTWISASKTNLSTIKGLINVQSPFGIMQVGRTNLKYPNGTFQQIGKIWTGSLYHINTAGTEQAIAVGYEVLICTPSV